MPGALIATNKRWLGYKTTGALSLRWFFYKKEGLIIDVVFVHCRRHPQLNDVGQGIAGALQCVGKCSCFGADEFAQYIAVGIPAGGDFADADP